MTPLLIACSGKNPDMVRVLVEAGANPKIADDHGMTPLHAAVQVQPVETVRLLLKHGAAVNAKHGPSGRTALHIVAGEGKLEIMKSLLVAGADPNVIDAYGDRPMDFSADAGQADEVELLTKYNGAPAPKQR